MKKSNKGMGRRNFLGLSALGLTGLTILPSWTINGIRTAPSDRVVMGFIGLGQQALSDFAGLRARIGKIPALFFVHLRDQSNGDPTAQECRDRLLAFLAQIDGEIVHVEVDMTSDDIIVKFPGMFLDK